MVISIAFCESWDFNLFSSSSAYSLPDLIMTGYSKSSGKTSSRKITFFVPGGGIDREVISTDICRYLGNDATVKPGAHTVCNKAVVVYTVTITNVLSMQDTETGGVTNGFYVTAYRALTTVSDIRYRCRTIVTENCRYRNNCQT